VVPGEPAAPDPRAHLGSAPHAPVPGALHVLHALERWELTGALGKTSSRSRASPAASRCIRSWSHAGPRRVDGRDRFRVGRQPARGGPHRLRGALRALPRRVPAGSSTSTTRNRGCRSITSKWRGG
jgi:hypothetical protein